MKKKCEICHNKCETNALFCVRCGSRFDEYRLGNKLLAYLNTAYTGIVHHEFYVLQQSLAVVKDILNDVPVLFESYRSHFDVLCNKIESLGCDSRPFEWFAIVESFINALPENAYPELKTKLQKIRKLFSLLADLNDKWQKKPVSTKKAEKIIKSRIAKLDFSPDEVDQAIFDSPQLNSKVVEILDPELYEESHAQCYTFYARECIDNKKYREASEWLESALREDHDYWKAYEVGAELFLQQNDVHSAVVSMRKAIELGSESCLLFNNLAWYICETNSSEDELKEALVLARQAVFLAPLAYFWDTLAEVHERMGNIPEAMAACAKSLRLADPESEDEYKERLQRLCLSLDLRRPIIKRENPEVSTDAGSVPRSSEKKGLKATIKLCPRRHDEKTHADDTGSIPPPSACASGESSDAPPRRVLGSGSIKCKASYRRRNIFSRLRNMVGDTVEYFREWAEERRERAREKAAAKNSKILDALKVDKSKESIEDPVDCTVFSPPRLNRGHTVFVQVFAHLPAQKDEAAHLAKEFDEDTSRRGFRSLNLQVKRGTRLMFHLDIPSFSIDEPVQELIWNGRAEAVQFAASAPADCKLGDFVGTVTASIDTVPVGHVKFKIKVVADSEQSNPNEILPTGNDMCRYHKAFISYASKDREKVLSRVQMLKTLGIDCFQDILDLEPGARWEKELYRHIDHCDIFLLFWSSAARDSEWVMKEVRYAISRQEGKEHHSFEIRPVIIEGPPIIPPPDELAHLHFNDKLIYLMKR